MTLAMILRQHDYAVTRMNGQLYRSSTLVSSKLRKDVCIAYWVELLPCPLVLSTAMG